MGRVSALLGDRWRSGKQVGDAAPTHRVTVTRGLMDKDYKTFVPAYEGAIQGNSSFGTIKGGNNHKPWHGFFRATVDPKELPNFLSIKWQQEFCQKGARTLTLEVENILFKAVVGVQGVYHQIRRGVLSPWLGLKLAGRFIPPNWAQEEEWFEVLDNGYRVDVWEGYGDQLCRTFVGFIEDADIETQPDRITITARDLSILFTDMRVVGFNKAPEMGGVAITLSDKKSAEKEEKSAAKVKTKGWLLVKDATDVIARVFLWAGFKEWRINKFGLSLLQIETYGMEQFFQDMIDQIQAQANWVYFMESPTEHSQSIGRPVFEKVTAIDPPPRGMLEVRDTDLLESLKFKADLSKLPFIIRYRGNVDKNGTTYGSDTAKRFNAAYFPPWSGAGRYEETGINRVAGVRRHEVVVDEHLLSDNECMVAAIRLAMEFALEAYTAEVQISGYPGFELNQQFSVVDHTTGINSRIWVSGIQSDHQCGKEANWKMTVQGAVIDSLDLQRIKEDLALWEAIVKDEQKNRTKLPDEPYF